METSSGDIRMDALLDVQTLDITTSSGDILLNEGTLSSLTVESSSGEMEFYELAVSGHTQLHSSSGDIELTEFTTATMGIQTSSGDVQCQLITPMNYHVRTNSGSVNIPERNSAGGDCDIRTSSGNIKITIKE